MSRASAAALLPMSRARRSPSLRWAAAFTWRSLRMRSKIESRTCVGFEAAQADVHERDAVLLIGLGLQSLQKIIAQLGHLPFRLARLGADEVVHVQAADGRPELAVDALA